MRRIDVHAHFAPKEYLAAIRRFAPAAERLPDCSTARLLESMERFRIDAAVLSLTPPGVFFGDLGQARELARLVNEHASQLRRDHPGRLAALGFLPLPDLAGSIEEAAYALDVLHLDGLELLTNVAGTYVGDSAWDPLFAELDRRAAYVFVHPCLPPYRPPLAEHPPWLYEFPFETTRAIANLVYSGTLPEPAAPLRSPRRLCALPGLPSRLAVGAGARSRRTCAEGRPRLHPKPLPRHSPGRQRSGAHRRVEALLDRPDRLRDGLAVRSQPA